MAERKFLQVYHNWLDAMTDLDDAERGRLFTALLTYSISGTVPEMPGNERYVFRCLQWFVDQDREAYERKCEVNRANGRRGGRPREHAAETVPAASQPAPLQSEASQAAPQAETVQSAPPQAAPLQSAPLQAAADPAGTEEADRTEPLREREPVRREEPDGSSFLSGKANGGQQEEEKEQEQKQKQEEEHSPLNPPAWGDRLTRAAQSWLAYKREKGQAYRPRGEKKLYEQIASCAERFGQEAVADVIEQSMASNYQGITWDRLNAGTPKSARTDRRTGGPPDCGPRRTGPEEIDPGYLAWMQAFTKKHPLPPPDSSPQGPPGGA